MDDYEVPSAPPTPTMTRNVPNIPPRHTPGSKKLLEPIQADEQKCAICHLNSFYMTPHSRVEHMNQCWDTLRQRAQDNVALKKNLMRLIQDTKMSEGGEGDDDSTSSSSSDDTTTPSTPPKYTPATNLPLYSVQIPPTSCLICATNLAHVDLISSFTHRVYCITTRSPLFCPICSIKFLHPIPWDKPDVAWHLHNCHNGGALTQVDKDAFEALTAAWSGRMEVLERVLMRDVGGGAQGVSAYKTKKESGIWRGNGVYWSGETGLRICNIVRGEDMEIRTCWEASVPKSVDMERFRRTTFAVLDVPKDAIIPEGWRVQGVTVEKENLGCDYHSHTEQSVDELDCDGASGTASSSPEIKSPPGLPLPTTTMEMLDAVLDVMRRSRAQRHGANDNRLMTMAMSDTCEENSTDGLLDEKF